VYSPAFEGHFVFGDSAPKNPYEVLGVSRTATQGDIRKTYKKLALQFHPDKNPGDDAAAEKFSAINAAYEIIGNPDKRGVYDDFGTTKTGHTGFNTYWEFVNSNMKSENDFYIGDSMITRLTQSLWSSRVTGESVWLVNFYAPWCTHCQQAIPKYKALAGKLDGIVEVAAFNCHKEKDYCTRLGIGEYPTFVLISPKLGAELRWPAQMGDLTELLYNWVMPNVEEWKTLENVQLHSITTANINEKLKNSAEFWVVMFGSVHAKQRCDAARLGLMKMSQSLGDKINLGVIDCEADTPLCASENPGKALYFNVFPIFRAYSRGRGKNKISEEIFTINTVDSKVALEIIERTVRLLLRVEKKCDCDNSEKKDL